MNETLKIQYFLKNYSNIKTFLEKNKISNLTNTQTQIFETLEKKKNTIIVAPTGTGKTLGMIMYIIDEVITSKRIFFYFVPTNELVNQIYKIFNKSNLLNVKILNDKSNFQLVLNAQVIIGTPSNFLKYSFEFKKHFKNKINLVLDEVDTLIQMGFVENIRSFIKDNNFNINKKYACSATIPKNLMQQLKIWFKEYENIIINDKSKMKLDHIFLITKKEKKFEDLLILLKYAYEKSGTIVFANTKEKVISIYNWIILNSKFRPILFHGDLQEKERRKNMSLITHDERVIIITTDLLARGISLKHIQTVINFELPIDDIWYMHRAGRTGRHNQPGQLINLILPNETSVLKKLISKGINFIEAKIHHEELVLKKKRAFKFKINDEITKEIKKIISISSKQIKPNYKKKRNEKIKKIFAKEKRKKIESSMMKTLEAKWKKESILKMKKKQLKK